MLVKPVIIRIMMVVSNAKKIEELMKIIHHLKEYANVNLEVVKVKTEYATPMNSFHKSSKLQLKH